MQSQVDSANPDSPSPLPEMQESLLVKEEKRLERFFSQVKFTGYCWEWQGPLDPKGYGIFSCDGVNLRAHRWLYEKFIEKIPDYVPGGVEPDHICRNHPCVRPSHLEVVTHRTNVLRGNGFMAQRAKATHCQRDHEFTQENTILRTVNGRLHRRCRACDREGKKKTYWANEEFRKRKLAKQRERYHAKTAR